RLCRARGGGRRVHRVELHACSGADLCVDRRRLRRGDDGRAGAPARTSYRRHCHRRERVGDDGPDLAVVGAAGVVLAAHHRAPRPARQTPVRNVYAAMLIVGGVLATFPLLGLPLFYESFLYLVFHWIVLATSW